MMQQLLLAGGLKDPTAVYVTGATGVNSATIPAHAVGDLIVGFGFCDGSDTPPTEGAGFTNVDGGTVSGVGSWGGRIAYRIATVTNTASGTWTGATSLVFVVYRNALLGTGTAAATNVTTNIDYPAFSPSVPNGSSLVIAFAGSTVGDSSLETPPTGMVNRQTVAHAGDEAAAHETSAGSYLWGSQTVALGGTAARKVAFMYEIKST